MSVAQCQLQIPPVDKLPNEQLSVGRIFELHCQAGEAPLPIFDAQKVEIRLDQKDQYVLQLLSFAQKENEFLLKVTSYKAGEHQLQAVQLVDENHSIVLSPLAFSVQTALPPVQKQEAKLEPFGPIGPFQLGLFDFGWVGIYYLIFWISAALVLGTFIFLQIKRRLERKKLLLEMNQFGTSQTPYAQFTQSVRKWMREFDFLAHPNKILSQEDREKFLQQILLAYQLYLGRTFQVPTMRWPERVFMREIKKSHGKLYETCGPEMRNVLRELKHACDHQQAMKAQDLIQLLELTRKSIDALFLAERQKPK